MIGSCNRNRVHALWHTNWIFMYNFDKFNPQMVITIDLLVWRCFLVGCDVLMLRLLMKQAGMLHLIKRIINISRALRNVCMFLISVPLFHLLSDNLKSAFCVPFTMVSKPIITSVIVKWRCMIMHRRTNSITFIACMEETPQPNLD
jgi:hypothetical protein